MKGIILAAGKGTRLFPVTTHIPKPLLPIYDKPMVYYPLSLLITAGIKDILIIVPPDDMAPFEKLFGDGSHLGLNISYKEQKIQRGIADAFIVGGEFIGTDSVCLMLGDNIFVGDSLNSGVKSAALCQSGGVIFGCYVNDPRPFGVVEFDIDGRAISLEEKPQNPKSNYIVPGMYFYDNDVIEIAKNISPSARGELEITTVNEVYMNMGNLKVITLDENVKWFDAGTPDSMLDAANFIAEHQKSKGKMVGCIEELSRNNGFITKEQLNLLGENLSKTPYGNYILNIK